MAQRKLEVVFVGDTKQLEGAFKRAGGAADKNQTKFAKFGKVVRTGMLAAGAGAAAGVAKVAADLGRIEKIEAQTSSAIKSTGGAANVTAAHVAALAGKLEGLTSVEAESIQEGQNLLLTFKGIRNEAGAGNKIFDRATQAMVDLNAKGFGPLPGISKMLGRALNDPTKGMTALTRAGVTFTKQQETQIKALDKSGDSLGAQKIMLREIESQVGGSGRALGETLPGKLAIAQHKFGEFAESVVANLLPAFERVIGFALRLADGFNALPAPLKNTIATVTVAAVALGGLALVFGPVIKGLGAVGAASTFMATKFAASAVGVRLASIVMRTSLLAAFGVIGVAIAAAIAAAVLLYKNWDTVVAGLGAAWDWMKGAAGDAFAWVKGAVTDSWNTIRSVTSAVWSAISSALSTVWGAIRSTVSTVWNAIRSTIESVWSAIRSATSAVWSAIRSALSAVWDSIRAAMSSAWNALVGVAEAGWNAIRSTTSAIWAAIRAALSTVWGAIRSAASTAWGAVRAAVVDPVRSAVDFVTERVGDLRSFLDKAWKTIVSGVDKIKGPFVSAFREISQSIEKVVGWLGKVVDGVKEAVSFLGKLKLPKINLPDLNPFGGVGNGTTVGPSKGRPASVDGFNGIAASFGNVVTSGFRPGDDGWHGRNRARDYAGGNMMGFARAMMAYAPNLLELIHTPLGVGVKNGQVVPMSFFGGDVAADHRDHVHVAMAQGGIATGGYVRVGELGPETVQLPAGSRVTQASESTGTAPGVMVNIERLVNEADPREIAREIAWQIGH